MPHVLQDRERWLRFAKEIESDSNISDLNDPEKSHLKHGSYFGSPEAIDFVKEGVKHLVGVVETYMARKANDPEISASGEDIVEGLKKILRASFSSLTLNGDFDNNSDKNATNSSFTSDSKNSEVAPQNRPTPQFNPQLKL